MHKRLVEIIDDATIILQGGKPEWPFSRSPLANELHDFLEKIEKGKEVEKAKKDKGKMEQIDCCFIEVGVFIKVASRYKKEIISILHSEYDPKDPRFKNAEGYSFLAEGLFDRDEADALRLMALGKVLKLWTLNTPVTLGYEGEEAEELARLGYIFVTGFWIKDWVEAS